MSGYFVANIFRGGNMEFVVYGKQYVTFTPILKNAWDFKTRARALQFARAIEAEYSGIRVVKIETP